MARFSLGAPATTPSSAGAPPAPRTRSRDTPSPSAGPRRPKVTTYTLKDVSIDGAKFGIKAVGAIGMESLVTAYVYPARP